MQNTLHSLTQLFEDRISQSMQAVRDEIRRERGFQQLPPPPASQYSGWIPPSQPVPSSFYVPGTPQGTQGGYESLQPAVNGLGQQLPLPGAWNHGFYGAGDPGGPSSYGGSGRF